MRQITDATSDDNINSHVEQRPPLRNDYVYTNGLTTQSITDNGIQAPGRISPAPAPVKKRTFSKIINALTGRSGSLSIPTNNDPLPITPTSPEVNKIQTRTIVSSSREPVKRAVSVVSCFFQCKLMIKNQFF